MFHKYFLFRHMKNITLSIMIKRLTVFCVKLPNIKQCILQEVRMLLRNLHPWGKIGTPRNGLCITPMVVIKLRDFKIFLWEDSHIFFLLARTRNADLFHFHVQSYCVQLYSFSKRPVSGHLHTHWDCRCAQETEFLV